MVLAAPGQLEMARTGDPEKHLEQFNLLEGHPALASAETEGCSSADAAEPLVGETRPLAVYQAL